MRAESESSRNNALTERTATRIAVMTVNPYLLHAYWQISERDLENIRHTLHEARAEARPVLRFYEITGILFDGTNAHHIFDIEVDLRTREWNVPIWTADKSYVVDLGYKASDGNFYQIARSNVAIVPRSGPSGRLAERYLRVEGGQIKGPLPVKSAHVPRRKPLETPRVETVHDMPKETGGHFKGKAEQPKSEASGRTSQDLKEANVIPIRVPETAAGEKRVPFGDVSCPFDLVYLTEERLSFGVSSPAPGRETNF